MKKPHEHRPKDAVHDRAGLGEAISIVAERIAADDTSRTAARLVCGFLQESFDLEVLGQPDFETDPAKAYLHKTFLRGVSHGIETAIDHLTSSDQIRELREWNEDHTQEP